MRFETGAMESILVDGLPVLSVYVVWHPDCERAAEYANAIFRELCADPLVPASRGLGLQIRFRTSRAAVEVPVALPFHAAEHTVVFVLADEYLVGQDNWRSYVDGLASTARAEDQVIPVALTRPSFMPPALGALQAIRLDGVAEPEKEILLLNGVIHDLCRLLDPDAAKVKVFLSHAKHDGLEITTAIRNHLRDVEHLDEFFDTADIPDGLQFGQVLLENAASSPVLLAVQTDTYASREWCRLEVLAAKRARVPIVVLSAVEIGESRSFPYIGNVPTVRWHGESSIPVVIHALLREVLRRRYFPLRVEAICRHHRIGAQDLVTSAPPELLTIFLYVAEAQADGREVGRYLYPDPPLGTEEVQLLRDLAPDLDPVTPTILLSL